MHVKISTLPMDIALDVAEIFKLAGIKSELKPYFDVEMEEVGYIEGRLSEIIEKYSGTRYEGEVKKWKEYLNSAKDILSGPMKVKDFISAFVGRYVDDSCRWEEVLKSNVNRICEEKGVDIDELSEEEKGEIIGEALYCSREAILEGLENQFEKARYEYIATKILEFSGVDIESDEIIERLEEDPEISIKVKVDDVEEAEKLGVEVNLEINVAKMCDIYVSVVDAMYKREKLLKIVDEFDEAFQLLVIADIAAATYRHLKRRGKVDVGEIFELLEDFELDEWIRVNMDEDSVKELLRLLEKEGFIKIKKGKVRALD